MTVSRRMAFGALLGLPSAIGSVSSAKAKAGLDLARVVPLTSHPFLGVGIPRASDGGVAILRPARTVSKHGAENDHGAERLAVRITTDPPHPTVYRTIEEAEVAALTILSSDGLTTEKGSTTNRPESSASHTNVMLASQASESVESRTMRGPGNVLMIHEQDIPLIEGNFVVRNEEGETSGHWSNRGMICFPNKTLTIWTTSRTHLNAWLSGSAIIAYRGAQTQMDAAAVLVPVEGGFRLALPNPLLTTVARSGDYLKQIRLVTSGSLDGTMKTS